MSGVPLPSWIKILSISACNWFFLTASSVFSASYTLILWIKSVIIKIIMSVVIWLYFTLSVSWRFLDEMLLDLSLLRNTAHIFLRCVIYWVITFRQLFLENPSHYFLFLLQSPSKSMISSSCIPKSSSIPKTDIWHTSAKKLRTYHKNVFFHRQYMCRSVRCGPAKLRNSVCNFIQENILKFVALFYRLLKELQLNMIEI